MHAGACVCIGTIVVSGEGWWVADEYAGGCCRDEWRWGGCNIWHLLRIVISAGGTRVPVFMILPASDKWWVAMRYVDTVIRCNSSDSRLDAFDWHRSLNADRVVR